MKNSLSRSEMELLPEWRDRWTTIGLSCEPLDFERAKDAAARAYIVAGLKPPARWVVCDGPLSGAITAATLKGNSVVDSVVDSVGDSVGNSVGNSVWASVRASVWASVRASVRASVWDSVGDSVRDSVWNSVGNFVWNSVYGAHDAHWLGFYDYFLSALGMAEPEPLRPLIDLAHHCGWWIPYENVCILQHRHSSLHRDEQGRLHNPAGMAVAYRDGWGVYSWHGLRVPEHVIMEPPTVDKVLAEANAEYKRVLIERLTPERFMTEINATAVAEDEYGRLWRADIGDREPYTVVEVINGTPNPDGTAKVYWLTVPHRNELRGNGVIATAHEAVAWSYGLLPTQYDPIIRT